MFLLFFFRVMVSPEKHIHKNAHALAQYPDVARRREDRRLDLLREGIASARRDNRGARRDNALRYVGPTWGKPSLE